MIQSVLNNPFIGEKRIAPYYRSRGITVEKCISEKNWMRNINETNNKIVFNVPHHNGITHIYGSINDNKDIRYSFY